LFSASALVSAAIARLSDVPAGILAGCDRLVHPAVTGRAERDRQCRFIAVMLASPFAAGVILAFVAPARVEMGMLLAVLCGITAISWTLALIVSLTGRGTLAERAALALAGMAVAGAAASGGALSPLL